jgi:PAS domain S-box-containing protein
MTAETKYSQKYEALRKRAEGILDPVHRDGAEQPDLEATRNLLHELHTHQIEIELQNEELWKTQQELMESRDRYTYLYDFAPVGYLTINEQGVISEANLTMTKLLGVEKKSLLQQPFSRFIAAEDQDIYYQQSASLRNTGLKQSYELKLKKEDGGYFDAQVESVISSGVTTGQFMVCITDISERKYYENAILKSKKEWEKSFDAITDLITIQDKDMNIVRANKATYDFFRVELGGLIGKKCYELFRGSTEPCSDCPVPGICSDSTNHSCLMSNEKIGKIFTVTTAPICDEHDKFQYVVHVAKDVTEQKQAEAQFLQAHKMQAIGTLASGIAHDFNNILQAIIGFAEMVRYDVSENSRAQSNIDQVLQSANRAKELVGQILDFSRKKPFTKILAFQPDLIVKEVVKMMRSTIPAVIQINAHIDANCNPVLADPSQFHQIVVNLFTNAYHSLQNVQGSISVTLANKVLTAQDIMGEPDISPGLFSELVISDTGTGMDQKTIERIFEPYFTTKEVGHGSGIGLAVVHGLVKSSGGMIGVESKIGKGSTFRVFLPAAEAKGPGPSVENNKITLPTGTERILIVDDEETIVDLNQQNLSRLGYFIIPHTSSVRALEDFRRHSSEIDLVITDMSMPSMTGTELVGELLKIKKDLPIILCTGFSSMVPEDGARELGVKKIVMKPIDRTTMAKTVREVLDSCKK